MAHFKKPTALSTNATAPFTTTQVENPKYNRWGAIQTLNLEFLAGLAGAPTFSAQPQQSNDGTNWHDIGSPVAAIGASQITVTMPWFQVAVGTLSAGGLTVVVS